MSQKKIILLLLLFIGVAMAIYFTFKRGPVVTVPTVEKIVATDSIPKLMTLTATSVFFNDMENPDQETWRGDRSSEKYFSGQFSNKLSDQIEYGITFLKKGSEISQYDKIKQARVSFQIYSDQQLKKANLVFAVTGTSGKILEYHQEEMNASIKKWNPVEMIIPVNPSLWTPDAILKFYPWNEGKGLFYIDDIKIEFFTEEESSRGIKLRQQQNFFYDFEPAENNPSPGNQSNVVAHSGSYSIVLSGSDTYSDNIIRRFSDVAYDTVKFISASIWIYPKDNDPVVTLVVALEHADGTSITWQGKATDKMNLKKNQWHKINFRADLREIKTSPEDISKVYLWNKKGGTVYADDLEIVYGDVPKPEGASSGVIINLSGDIISTPGKNKPPFKQELFSADSVFNPSTVYLINDEKKGELNPEDLVLAGRFISRNNSGDDIFIANKTGWSLYTWCNNDKKFVQSFSGQSTDPVNGKIAVKGFFEDMNQEEILLFDTSGKIEVQRIKYSGNAEKICNKNSDDKIKQDLLSQTINGFDLSSKSWNVTAGNFTGDNRSEIAFISSDGQWVLLAWRNGRFEIEGTGKMSFETVRAVQQVAMSPGRDRVLLFSEKDHKPDYCMLDFSAGKNNCSIIEFKDKSFLAFYNTHSVFFSGKFEKSSYDLFYLDKEWRFDFKKVLLNDNGITIQSQMDFKQPDQNRNPKYYEYSKFIKGDFFGTGVDALLVMMRNCKDANFNGRHCREFEEVKGMPSGFLFYHYKAAE